MEIIHDDYQVHYDTTNATVSCHGSFRLRGDQAYTPILQVLLEAANTQAATLTLDLRQLQFLNSSGINILSKFILQVRQNKLSRLVIRGNSQYPWQQKSLTNLQRLLPELTLEIE